MKKNIRSQNGFSYIEVMIGIVILMVGILAMLSVLSANLVRSYASEKSVIAKQAALSTIESIISAKEIARPGVVEGWDAIGNVGTNPVNGQPRGIFLTDWCPIREDAGWDGVAGTIDDACPGENPCAVSGRPTNSSRVIQGFERRIVITDVEDSERPSPPNPISRRKIEVQIRYFVNQSIWEERVSTMVTNY